MDDGWSGAFVKVAYTATRNYLGKQENPRASMGKKPEQKGRQKTLDSLSILTLPACAPHQGSLSGKITTTITNTYKTEGRNVFLIVKLRTDWMLCVCAVCVLQVKINASKKRKKTKFL